MDTPVLRYWRVPERANMAWRHWDDEFVFHHRLSNDTHQLSCAAGELMLCLLENAELSESDLAVRCDLSGEELTTILHALAQLDFVTWR